MKRIKKTTMQSPIGVIAKRYDGRPDAQVIEKLNRQIKASPFKVRIARTFPQVQSVSAQ